MSFTYVIPDVHGRIDLLRDGFAGIIGHAAGRLGTLVALDGDDKHGIRFSALDHFLVCRRWDDSAQPASRLMIGCP